MKMLDHKFGATFFNFENVQFLKIINITIDNLFIANLLYISSVEYV